MPEYEIEMSGQRFRIQSPKELNSDELGASVFDAIKQVPGPTASANPRAAAPRNVSNVSNGDPANDPGDVKATARKRAVDALDAQARYGVPIPKPVQAQARRIATENRKAAEDERAAAESQKMVRAANALPLDLATYVSRVQSKHPRVPVDRIQSPSPEMSRRVGDVQTREAAAMVAFGLGLTKNARPVNGFVGKGEKWSDPHDKAVVDNLLNPKSATFQKVKGLIRLGGGAGQGPTPYGAALAGGASRAAAAVVKNDPGIGDATGLGLVGRAVGTAMSPTKTLRTLLADPRSDEEVGATEGILYAVADLVGPSIATSAARGVAKGIGAAGVRAAIGATERGIATEAGKRVAMRAAARELGKVAAAGTTKSAVRTGAKIATTFAVENAAQMIPTVIGQASDMTAVNGRGFVTNLKEAGGESLKGFATMFDPRTAFDTRKTAYERAQSAIMIGLLALGAGSKGYETYRGKARAAGIPDAVVEQIIQAGRTEQTSRYSRESGLEMPAPVDRLTPSVKATDPIPPYLSRRAKPPEPTAFDVADAGRRRANAERRAQESGVPADPQGMSRSQWIEYHAPRVIAEDLAGIESALRDPKRTGLDAQTIKELRQARFEANRAIKAGKVPDSLKAHLGDIYDGLTVETPRLPGAQSDNPVAGSSPEARPQASILSRPPTEVAQSLLSLPEAVKGRETPETFAAHPLDGFRVGLDDAVRKGTVTRHEASGVMTLMDRTARAWAAKNGSTPDEFYRQIGTSLENVDPQEIKAVARTPVPRSTVSISDVFGDRPKKQARTETNGELGIPVGESRAQHPEGGEWFPMQNRIVSLDELVASHDPATGGVNPEYTIKELQGRDRTGRASREQVVDNAAKLDRNGEVTTDFLSTEKGAPIVGMDRMVESGNGRVMAMRLARDAENGRWTEYQQKLLEAHPEAAGIKDPVLIRTRAQEMTPHDRIEFARKANGDTTMAASTTEAARSAADTIPSEAFDALNPVGRDLESAMRSGENDAFVQSLLTSMDPAEARQVASDPVKLAARGKQAILAKVLGAENADVLKRLVSADDYAKRVATGLDHNGVALVKALRGAEMGATNDVGLQGLLGDSMRIVDEYAASDNKKGFWVQSRVEPLDPSAARVAHALVRSTSQAQVDSIFAGLARKASEASDGGLFEDGPAAATKAADLVNDLPETFDASTLTPREKAKVASDVGLKTDELEANIALYEPPTARTGEDRGTTERGGAAPEPEGTRRGDPTGQGAEAQAADERRPSQPDAKPDRIAAATDEGMGMDMGADTETPSMFEQRNPSDSDNLSQVDYDPTHRMEHRPMTIEGGAASLDTFQKVFGDDAVNHNALQYYGSGDPREATILKVIRAAQNNPERPVKIYRGAPEGTGGDIRPGDWITLDKRVAQDYADEAAYGMGKKGVVIEKTVPASHVTAWTDSYMEQGYHPPANPSIVKQESPTGTLKGNVEFTPDQRAVIRLFTGAADVSTLVHEMAHIFRRTLGDADNAIVEKHYGKLGTVESEEGFARGFERYLRNGKTDIPELKAVFESFKAWLTQIYAKVKGSPIERDVHPEIHDLFERMLGRDSLREEPTPPAKAEPTPKAKEAASLFDGVPTEKADVPTPYESPTRKPLNRAFTAGDNRGEATFASALQRDLYDLGAIEAKRSKQGRLGTEDAARMQTLKGALSSHLGMDDAQTSALAMRVREDVRAQMKGIGDGETRQLKDGLTTVERNPAPVETEVLDDPTPEVVPAPETTGLSMAQRSKEAAEKGTAEPKSIEQMTNAEAHAKGKADVEDDPTLPERLVQTLAKENRAARPDEYGAILEGSRRLLATINARARAVDAAKGAPDHAEALAAYDEAKSKAAEFDGYLDRVKSASGASMQALKIRTTVDTGDFASVVREAERYKGSSLEPKDEARIKGLIEAHEKLQSRIEAVEAERDALAANAVRNQANESVRTQRATRSDARSREAIRADRAEAVKAFNKATLEAGSRASVGVPVSAEQLKALASIAKTYIEEGALTLDETVAKVKAFLAENGVEGVVDRDIHEAIAGRSAPVQGPPTETKARLAELRRVARLTMQIGDANQGVKVDARGRSPVPDEVARLRKIRDEIRKEKGLNPETKRIARTVEETVSALEERVREIDEMTARGEVPPKRVREAEAEAVTQARRRLSESRTINRLTDSVSELEKMSRSDDPSLPEPKRRRPDSPEVEDLRSRQDLLKKQILQQIENAKPQGFGQKARILQRAFRLTNPTARLYDVASNAVVLADRQLGKPIESAIDRILFPRKRETEGAASSGWSLDRSRKVAKGAATRWRREFEEQMTVGDPELMAKLGSSDLRTRNDALNLVVNKINRFAGSTDIPFKDAMYEGVLRELSEAKSKVTGEGAETIYRAAKDGTGHQDLNLIASNEAVEGIFGGDNMGAHMIDGAVKPLPPGVRFFVDLVAPFPRIFTNIVAYGTDFVPGSAILKAPLVKAGTRGEPFTLAQRRTVNRLLARNLRGLAYLSIGYYAAQNGLVEGEEGSGGAYVDYGELESAGGPMPIILAGATYFRAGQMDEATGDKLVYSTATGLFTNQPAISGPVRFFAGLKTDPGKAVGQAASGLIPGMIREWARRQDKIKNGVERRETHGFVEAVKSNVPFLRESLPPIESEGKDAAFVNGYWKRAGGKGRSPLSEFRSDYNRAKKEGDKKGMATALDALKAEAKRVRAELSQALRDRGGRTLSAAAADYFGIEATEE